LRARDPGWKRCWGFKDPGWKRTELAGGFVLAGAAANRRALETFVAERFR
jgi:hypothetical protein